VIEFENPMLAVDVVTVRFRDNHLQLALGHRLFEPNKGELALAGVLMRAGETVADAACRAVTSKLGIDGNHIRHIKYGKVFDTPTRDSRGPTISLGCIAVIEPDANGTATWVGFEEIPKLPFDHNVIVDQIKAWMLESIWMDPPLLAALLGDPFPTTAMVALDSDLAGEPPTPSNIHRKLGAVGFLTSTQRPPIGRGRPQTWWRARAGE